MPSLSAIQKEMRYKETDNGLKLNFEVQVSVSGLVQVNGQPVGRHLRGSNEIGWVSVFEHFALQMIELRKMQERKTAGRPVTGRTSRAPTRSRTPKASPLDRPV